MAITDKPPCPGAGPHNAEPPPRLWLRRLGWLLLIWCASVATLFVAALALRGLMGLLGMQAG